VGAVTARVIQAGQDMWHVFGEHDGDYLDYAGLVKQFGDTFRAYGARIGIDNQVVAMESPDFGSRDEAEDWLLDEDEAES
jgi:hypothetical protein